MAHPTPKTKHTMAGGALVALLLATPVLAPAAVAQGQPDAAEVNRIIEELAPRRTESATYGDNIRTRTVKVRPDIAQQNAYRTNAIIEERVYTLNYNHTEDFTVNFRFDSFALTPQARLTLDYVGQALTDPRLARESYLVAGHTDTVGADDYNQWLSERRAYAVADYLNTQWGVEFDRLYTAGFGEEELLDPRRGANRANRRVEFTLIDAVGGESTTPAPAVTQPAAPAVTQVVPAQPTVTTTTQPVVVETTPAPVQTQPVLTTPTQQQSAPSSPADATNDLFNSAINN